MRLSIIFHFLTKSHLLLKDLVVYSNNNNNEPLLDEFPLSPSEQEGVAFKCIHIFVFPTGLGASFR